MDKKYIELITEDGSLIHVSEDDDIPFNLTYALLDLQFLDKRSGAFSNIFKLPATKSNSLKFKHYSNSQITYPQSNSFLNQERLQIIANGTNIFNGFIRGISSIKRLTPEAFEAQVIGNNLEWADALSNMQLNSLTYPTVNYDINTVRSSWNNTYLDGYVAPLVCYGKPKNWNQIIEEDTPIAQNGLPNFDSGLPGQDEHLLKWEYVDFRYWIFIRPLIFEMFEKAGYRLISNFLTSAEASKFIMYINDFDFFKADEDGFFPFNINLGTDLIKNERKCIDLLRGLQNMFNLFFTTDEDTKTVYCEPFDEFISLFGTPKDWTEKIDYSKETKIKQYSSLLENILFDLKEDAISRSSVEKNNVINKFVDGKFYQGGLSYNNLLKEKKYSNNFFEGYSMCALPTADFSFKSFGAPNYIYPSGTSSPNCIVMPCIWENSFSDKILLDTAFAGTGSAEIMEMPDKSGVVEPKFAYYAGMTTIEPAMAFGRFHSQITGNNSIISGMAKDIFLYHTDTVRTQRPYAFMCDVFYEEDKDSPKNYYFSQQQIEIFTGTFPGYVLSDFEIDGLTKKYYLTLLKSVLFGKNHQTPIKISDKDLLILDFRSKYILENSENILLEISKFNPLINQSTYCSFLEIIFPELNDYQFLNKRQINFINSWVWYQV